MYRCMYISVYMCMYAWLLVCTRICMCMWVYTYVSVCSGVCLVYIYIYLYVLVTCYSISDLFGEIRTSCRRPGPDSDSCSLWTRYNGDSKTDPWDDP